MGAAQGGAWGCIWGLGEWRGICRVQGLLFVGEKTLERGIPCRGPYLNRDSREKSRESSKINLLGRFRGITAALWASVSHGRVGLVSALSLPGEGAGVMEAAWDGGQSPGPQFPVVQIGQGRLSRVTACS